MASQGPLYPGTVTTEVGPAGANDWTTPGNISADDGAEAQITAATYDASDNSYRLIASNFGFTIPAIATINGIVVEIEQRRFAGAAVDIETRLRNGAGTIVGDEKASATAWPATATIRTYGSSTDLWNAGLTVADINDVDFGVTHIVQATAANTDIGVDFVRVTVYYTEPVSVSPGLISETDIYAPVLLYTQPVALGIIEESAIYSPVVDQPVATSRHLNGTSDYMRNTSAVKSAPPFTMVAWVWRDTDASATAGRVIELGRAGDDHWYTVWIGSGREVRAGQNGTWGGTDPTVTAGALLTNGRWEHIAATFTSDTARAVFLNGANKATNSQPVTTTAPTSTTLGASSRTTAASFFDGKIAHAAVYDVVLTDQEIADLAAGALPSDVQSANLLAYWPLGGLASPEVDEAGTFDLTLTGTTKGADGPDFVNLINDKFTEASTIALTSHVPDKGTGWTEEFNNTVTGVMNVSGGNGYAVPSAGFTSLGFAYSASPSPTSDEYDLTFKFVGVNTDTAGRSVRVYARWTPSGTTSTHYALTIVSANNTSNDAYRLYRTVNNVSTIIATADGPVDAGDEFRLEIRDGSQTVYRNGTQILSATDTTITGAGKVGLGSGAAYATTVDAGGHTAVAFQWDSFTITELAGAVAVAPVIIEESAVYAPTAVPGSVSLVPDLLEESAVYAPSSAVVLSIGIIEESTIYGITVKRTSVFADMVRSLSPVAYWRLGDSSGATTAVAEVGPDGTITGATPGVLGLHHYDSDTAVSFDGTDYISGSSTPLITGDFTLIAWFRRQDSSGSSYHVPIGGVSGNAGGTPYLYIASAGNSFGLAARDGTNVFTSLTVTNDAFAYNNIHFLVGTFDGSNLRVYLDGVEVGTPVAMTGLTTGTSDWNIGRNPSLNYYANGIIDEVAVFDSALTALQIADLYAAVVKPLGVLAAFIGTSAILYSPQLVAGVSVGIIEESAIYSPTALVGSVVVVPDLLGVGEIYVPAFGAVLSVGIIEDSAVLAPTVAAGLVAVSPALLEESALYGLSVGASSVFLDVGLLSETAIYGPTTVAGSVSVVVALLTETSVYDPILAAGFASVAPDLISDTAVYDITFGYAGTTTIQMLVVGSYFIYEPEIHVPWPRPDLISESTLYEPQVSPRWTVAVSAISAGVVYSPTVVRSVVPLVVPLLQESVLFVPVVRPADIYVLASLLFSSEIYWPTIEQVIVTLGNVAISATPLYGSTVSHRVLDVDVSHRLIGEG